MDDELKEIMEDYDLEEGEARKFKILLMS